MLSVLVVSCRFSKGHLLYIVARPDEHPSLTCPSGGRSDGEIFILCNF